MHFPPPFAAATAQYSAQVKFSPDSSHLIHHAAGLPFTTVAADDPQAGAKHKFNFNASIAMDDLDLRNFDCDTGAPGNEGNPVRVELRRMAAPRTLRCAD